MTAPRLPTVIIALRPDGTLQIEAPGANGTRQKIEGPTLKSLPPEIVASLIDQQDRNVAAERAKLRDLQTQNIKYVDANHPGLAPRIWSDPNLIFNQALARKMRQLDQSPKPQKTKRPTVVGIQL